MTEQVDILLSRYFSGEATEQELRRLDDWLAESAENEAYFSEMTMLFQRSVMMPPAPDVNVSAALEDFKTYMAGKEKIPAKTRFNYNIIAVRRLFAAASVALLLGFAAFFTLFRDSAKNIQLAASDVEKQFELFEGAAVVLDPNSSLNYTSNNKNELKLTGKATFTVASTQEKKLLVQVGETYVKDIGTIFTVTANSPDEPVMVEVFEGEVLFYTAMNEGISVGQNETGVYDPSTKRFSFVQQETLDEIVFINAPLRVVVDELAFRYGAEIEIHAPSLNDVPISVSFDKYESLDVLMEILAETLMLDVSKTGNTYRIK